ncbi:MAG: hypothetical protein WBC51_01955 [Vicinamibacterales bacterium]
MSAMDMSLAPYDVTAHLRDDDAGTRFGGDCGRGSAGSSRDVDRSGYSAALRVNHGPQKDHNEG